MGVSPFRRTAVMGIGRALKVVNILEAGAKLDLNLSVLWYEYMKHLRRKARMPNRQTQLRRELAE